jgi:hypothetical protein
LLQHRVYLTSRAGTLVGEIFLYAFHATIIQFAGMNAQKIDSGFCDIPGRLRFASR